MVLQFIIVMGGKWAVFFHGMAPPLLLFKRINNFSIRWGRMLENVMFNKTNKALLSRAMDAAMLRSRTIANNIANVNTPGYRRVEVSFEEELRTALDRTRLQGSRSDDQHLDIGRKDLSKVHPEAYHPYDPTQPSGVNNVDIDMEMAKLAEAQIMYNYAVTFNKGMYRKMNAAIQAKSIPIQ
jgi:flagellar basal-body rod protein FlgB